MENNYEKFKNTLKTIFQIDRADLDFGIYRILNQKHEEITTFLDKDLLPQVQAELRMYESGDKSQLEAELAKLTAQLRELGVSEEDLAKNQKVEELRAKLNTAGRAEELESEVFSHLVHFFERYYEEGDFISKRRYKDGVYAIPYEGEEVKLHWANHDQYYIKTSERFKDFSFKVGDKGVHFRIREAETDANNNKNISGKDRRFVLCAEDFWQEHDGVLDIYFEYVSVDGKKKQDECSAEAVAKILEAIPDTWRTVLGAPAPTEKQKDRTILEKFLISYTSRNTFDYFIHKDLSTFLTRELDFYIKNEVMFLDDIENESAPKADQYLAKVKVIRSIGKKIIRMLAQLEDFQKKLWEKKKFVVGTGYCITLDLVPEQYYDTILQSDAQRADWKQLGFIDDATVLDHEYLRAHPTLSIDTKFFPEWRDELLASFDNLDERVNGVMINSENFGALNLLQERYAEQVKAIYIDPPYNTGEDEFPYKDNYKHSSWLSLIFDRTLQASKLVSNDGLFVSSIGDKDEDNREFQRYISLLDHIFGEGNFLANVIWHSTKSVTNTAIISESFTHNPLFAKNRNYFVKNRSELRLNDSIEGFTNPDNDPRGPWKADPFQVEGIRPNQIYKITNPNTGEVYEPLNGNSWKNEHSVFKQLIADGRIVFGATGEAGPQRKRFWSEAEERGRVATNLWTDVETTTNGTQQLKSLFNNKVFKNPKPVGLIHRFLELFSRKQKSALIMDYFSGSGTTGHAVLKLNREDNEKESGSGQRKYILVEMGAYFDTVTKPRMQKVVYSDEWSAGKPQDDGASGTREHIIKYFKLESYEDTLNNLSLVRTPEQQSVLDAHPNFREDYMLGYMLDVEAKGSVLKLDSFRNPFSYTIKLATDVVGETRETPVDLVETFNYLIGLKVATMRRHGEHLLVVEGETRTGQKTLVIWRNQDEVTNEGLNDFFNKQNYSSTDFEFDRIYVNGDNFIENLKADSDQWKVVTIEEEFHKRMFA